MRADLSLDAVLYRQFHEYVPRLHSITSFPQTTLDLQLKHFFSKTLSLDFLSFFSNQNSAIKVGLQK
uniref:Uncharacterized protein n=1 Tax=Anguilla anguilla TaxID=7936 RepID=A0A0E9WWT8_ANGAN